MRIAATAFSIVALSLCALGCERSEQRKPPSGESAKLPPPNGTPPAASTGHGQNVTDLPAMTTTPKQPNPGEVPTTDEVQKPTTGPTAGTIPNVSPGKNDAPPVEYGTGSKMVPGMVKPNAQTVNGETALGSAGSAEKPTRTAEGKIETVKGVEMDGEVELSELSKGVRVYVKVKGAPPGRRGIHIAEKGDCSDIAHDSMGGHFAPTGHDHGLPGAPDRHLGDLGNLTIAQDGTGVLDVIIPNTNLKDDDRLSLLGKALVIHQSEDIGNGPNGRSGAPIACAVLRED
jgi:Cu-Zn family superoxide dismutase